MMQNSEVIKNTPTNTPLNIRAAGLLDVPGIYNLLKKYSERGILLPRQESDIYASLREFFVIRDAQSDNVIGCAALQIYSSSLGEVRSLAVSPDFLKLGLGRRLVKTVEEEGRKIGLTKMMALTYEVDFFLRSGYNVVEMRELPEKVWGVCINCHKFRNCDEIAVVKYFSNNQN